MFLSEQMILRASVYNMSALIFHNFFYKHSATFSGLQMNTYAQWDGKKSGYYFNEIQNYKLKKNF